MTMADLGSDHYPILNTIELYPNHQKVGKRPKWMFKIDKWDQWMHDVENYVNTVNQNIPEEIKNFTDSLVEPGKDNFKKSKDIVNTKCNKIWWNEHCARATALRRRAKNKMRRQPTPQNIQNYRRLHAAARKIHKLAKRTAWRSYISKINPKTTSREIWRIIRNFKGLKNYKRSNLLHNNTTIHTIQEKSNILVKYYQSTMTKPNTLSITPEELRNLDHTANNFKDEAYNQRYNMHELENAIATLPSNKACGIDDIHDQFLLQLTQSKKNATTRYMHKNMEIW